MKKILFSVVITSYNSSKYIKKTLISLLNQSFKNFEVVLVDDGSTDNTISIVKKFKQQKKLKIKIIELLHKGSPARSRNVGILNSKGKYICFLDADDLFLKNKLFELNKTIKFNNLDVYYHNVILKHKKSNLICKNINKKNPFKDLIFNENKIVLSSSCVKKSFLIKKKIKFNENKKLISVEDYDFWLQIASFEGSFLLINKILGIYNLNETSISKNRSFHFLNTMYLLDRYKKYLAKDKANYFMRKIKIILSFAKISVSENNYYFFSTLIKYIIKSKKV